MAPAISAQTVYTLSGRIEDFNSREGLKSATIRCKTISQTVIANDSGLFVFKLIGGKYDFVASFSGYVTRAFSVELFEDKRFTIDLKKKPSSELDEVIVNARNQPNRVRETQIGTLKLNAEQIKRLPMALGEPDILRALTQKAGVSSTGDGAGGFHVRGGNPDQNLVLLDGAPLFNTSHLLGFYSTVSPDAIQDLTLYKGTMPSTFGGRLSSLLNIKVRPGNKTQMRYSGGLSPVSGRLFIDGPLGSSNKWQMTAGARVAFPNLALSLFPKTLKESRAFFYDGLFKLQFLPDDKNSFSLTAYRSFDRFRFDSTTAYRWLSNAAVLQHQYKTGNGWQWNNSLLYSEFSSVLEGLRTDYGSELESRISQKEIKTALRKTVNDNLNWEAGLSAVLYSISPGSEKPSNAQSQIVARTVEAERGRELAAFLSSDYSLSERISLQAGLRFVQYSYLGPQKVYTYAEGLPRTKESITDSVSISKGKSIQSYSGAEPRLLLKIGLSDHLAVKLGYHSGQQFLHLITNTVAISPVDFWKLSDGFLPQQKGTQYSGGIFYNKDGWEYSLEGFYKRSRNLVEYKNGATLLLNPIIETVLLKAEAYAYGGELEMARTIGRLTGQLNYTWSRTFTRVLTPFAIERVNDGDYFPSNIDRPHNLNLQLKVKMQKGWSFYTQWAYQSGRPATYPDGNYVINNTIVNNYSLRNQDRLPDYHRLDISFSCVTRRYENQKRYSVWNFSFYNVYGRANAFSVFFRREGLSLDAYRLSVIGSIVPSMSWNYYF